MVQEDKELLLKDLCARLPYGVKILHEGWNYEWDDELSTLERVVGIDDKFIYTKVIDTHNGEEYRDDKYPIDTFDDKPYLRPMSSMTEEEKNEIRNLLWFGYPSDDYDERSHRGIEVKSCLYDDDSKSEYDFGDFEKLEEFLLAHHFDYRGLIKKGLALEAPEGMYKTE